jgi:hypothetical protein
MQRNDLAYLFVGVASAAERRARATVETSAHIAAAMATPAVAVFEATPLARPVRRRTAEVSDPLVADGRATVGVVRRSIEEAVGRVTSDALDSRALDAAVDRVLSSGVARRVVTVVFNHPATDVLLAGVLNGPGVDRITAQVMGSRMLDQLTTRLLESNEFRQVLRHVMTSPEVRIALSQQTAGLAQDVTVGVRARTVTADDTVEHAARSLLRRPRRAVQPE